MVWDYRLSVICDPRLMGGQRVINRGMFRQAMLIWPSTVPMIRKQWKAVIAGPM